MANWSQSHFLQSLGWATLNSFWQMALLWCIYMGACSILKLNAHSKYKLSVLAIATGFAWFVFTFFYFFQSSSVSTISFFDQPVNESNSLLSGSLIAASVAYLTLLVFPSYRLFRNWRFVQKIKKQGLKKADLGYRLFVQKLAAQIGIKQKVFVYLSELVNSPVTIGYLKPVILLPVAALNNLSTQQVEAILLHELSHIKRFDYLVNFMISIISTFLYFNPFVRQFMKNIEQERENCCDQLVLQFGYDKLGYASALLTLEKLSVREQILALGAAGKHYLLQRVEKIIGMEKKKGFKRNQFAGIIAALFCIVVFNSVLIIKERKTTGNAYAYNSLNNPFNVFVSGEEGERMLTPGKAAAGTATLVASANKTNAGIPDAQATAEESSLNADQPVSDVPEEMMLTTVAADDVDLQLTTEQKDKVRSTVDATKKVVTNLQWKVVEKNIADAMSEEEKVCAKQQYEKEFEKTVNWKNLEQSMKAKYEQIDWTRVNSNVNHALTAIRMDSLEKNYTVILSQLNKASEQANAAVINAAPLPDQSLDDLKKSTEEMRKKVEVLKALRSPKKVVRL
jgi:bla regulator protein BlaR1